MRPMSQDHPEEDKVEEKTAIVHIRLTARVKVPVDDFNHENYRLSREKLMRQRALDKVRGSEMDFVFGGTLPKGMADVSANDLEVVDIID